MRPLTQARILALALLSTFVLMAGCASSWERYDESLYLSIKEATPEAYESHARLLAAIIAESYESGVKPPPGICAEYAFYLARLQRPKEGEVYLAKEVEYYPESQTFVAVLKRLMEGANNVIAPKPATPPQKQQ
jgi:hypothetical protein